ncbi:MAG: hypothetical protein AB8H03_17125 [Saprospiraceae bacterium]
MGSQNTNGTDFSPNGREFTPNGTFRFLFVVAGFEGYEGKNDVNGNIIGPNLDGWTNTISLDYQLPDYISYDPTTGAIEMNTLFFQEESDFDDPILMANDDNKVNLSNTINLMSKPNRDFKYIGNMFTDPSGKPVQVVIDANDIVDPSGGNTPNWSDAGAEVFEKMMEINPNFDYAKFDQRVNVPDFVDDNSTNPTSDGIIDFIVILYRYKQAKTAAPTSGWQTEPRSGMEDWNGSGGGVAHRMNSNTIINGFSVGSANTIADVGSDPRLAMFHEYAHSVFSCPHYAGGGTSRGAFYYKATGGIGATAFPHFFEPMHNAFERWFQGYITPDEPITNETISLGDFVTTGDAIRILIPNSGGQYLWIENHAGNHVLDNGMWQGREFGPNGFQLPNTPTGVYMYIEEVSGSYSSTTDLHQKNNRLKFLNASGNWDFEFDGTAAQVSNNNGPLNLFNRTLPNPISGNSPWVKNHFYDNNNERQHEDILRESFNGIETIPYRAYGASAVGFKSSSFLEGDIINIETNPSLVNAAHYINFSINQFVRRFDPFYLNGLSVEITEIDSDGNATLDIKFDYTQITNDLRWTGNIHLPNITEDNQPDLIISNSKKLTLDKSQTINTKIIDPITNESIRPSIFTIESGAQLLMEELSNFTIQRHSTLIIDEGAEVIMKNGACIVIEDTGILELKGNDITMMGEDALIIIKKGGTLRTADGVDFTFNIEDDVVDNVIVNEAGGYIAFEAGNIIDLGVDSDFVIERDLATTGKRFIQLYEDATLALIDGHSLKLKYGEILYEKNSRILVTNQAAQTAESIDLFGVDMAYNGVASTINGVVGMKQRDWNLL